MNILVRAPNWIGDQILAYPFFERLRDSYPQAKITVVCLELVKDLQFLGFVDEVFVLDKPKSKSYWHKFLVQEQMAKKLRAIKWDLAFTLPNSISSAYLLWRAGAQTRVGYLKEGRSLFLNQGLSWRHGKDLHRAKAYVKLLGYQDPNKFNVDDLSYFTQPKFKFDYKKHWQNVKQSSFDPKSSYVVIAPGATAESRRWPEQRFAKLAWILSQKLGKLDFYVLGGASETVLLKELKKEESVNWIDLTGKASIASWAMLLENALVTITNESGLSHVASLCGSPVQIICGAADPKRTKAIGPGPVSVAINAVECWPCERNHCSEPLGLKLRCLQGIEEQDVAEQTLSLLKSCVDPELQ